MGVQCQVAIVGAGPVGLMTACVLKSLNSNLDIAVFEKREEATRYHALRIGQDSIDRVVRTLLNANTGGDFVGMISEWRERSIATVGIQDALTQQAMNLGIRILKGECYAVSVENFNQFIQGTGASVIIGADGAHSQVRRAIGIGLVNEFRLSYLLELKYDTPDYEGRLPLLKIKQEVDEGCLDFETIGRGREGRPTKTVALQRFVNHRIHTCLLAEQDGIFRGTQENPWTMRSLGESNDPDVRRVYRYYANYFSEDITSSYAKPEISYQNERIVTFPLRVYQSEQVVKKHSHCWVLLVGDASSGLVLQRGVNKGFIEAALCAEAVSKFFESQAPEQIEEIPEPFEIYQSQTQKLFYKESRWARWKHHALQVGEWILSYLFHPFRYIGRGINAIWLWSRSPASEAEV